MGEEHGFVIFGIGLGVGDVVDVATVGTDSRRVYRRMREIEDGGFKIGSVGQVTEKKAESHVGGVLVVDIAKDGVLVAVGSFGGLVGAVRPFYCDRAA